MIAHIVTISWKAGGHPDAGALAADLTALAASVPSIVFYRTGTNLGFRPNGADYGVIAVAADREGLEAYLDEPAHLGIVAERMAPFIEKRQAIQLELGDLPAGWSD